MAKNTYVLLWLEGVFQAWGSSSRFSIKDSQNFPTKSGVLGLVLSAMGRNGEQVELLSKLSATEMRVVAFSKTETPQAKLMDYQTIGGGYSRKNGFENLCIPKDVNGKNTDFDTSILHKAYLQDVVFAVVLEVPDDIKNELIDGLLCPVYQSFLGRKNCIPTEFIYQGKFDELDDAVFHALDMAKQKNFYHRFSVIEGVHSNNMSKVLTLCDVPKNFGRIKSYGMRTVTII